MSAWIATPVMRVATSSDPTSAPMARKKAYMVMVMIQRKSRDRKNCDAVRCRLAMK